VESEVQLQLGKKELLESLPLVMSQLKLERRFAAAAGVAGAAGSAKAAESSFFVAVVADIAAAMATNK